MKTNVTCSLDSDLVARLDVWREPMGCGRSQALELLLEGLPAVSTSRALAAAYFDSNSQPADPGIHYDNPEFDMVIRGKSATDVAPPAPEPVASERDAPVASEPSPGHGKPGKSTSGKASGRS
jgi:hypothetical protein